MASSQAQAQAPLPDLRPRQRALSKPANAGHRQLGRDTTRSRGRAMPGLIAHDSACWFSSQRSLTAPAQSYPNRPIRLVVRISARRGRRHHRQALRAGLVGAPRPTGRGREQARHRRQPGERHRGQGRARRLHAAARHRERLHQQSACLWRGCRSIRSRIWCRSTSLVSNQIVLAVNPSVPANDLREFVELARAPSRRCSMRRSATAASIIWPWSCSSSTSASI